MKHHCISLSSILPFNLMRDTVDYRCYAVDYGPPPHLGLRPDRYNFAHQDAE
jgi:hypothetical protein